MDFLASLHETGALKATGPFTSPPDCPFPGLALHRGTSEEIRALFAKDPLVRTGRLTVQVFTWKVPKGAISFSRTRYPHSQAEL
jgi:uncharacterized protein YciI